MRMPPACIVAPEADSCSVLQTRTLRSLIGHLGAPLDGGSKDNAAIMTVLSSGQRIGDTIRRVALIDAKFLSNKFVTFVFPSL